MWAASTRLHAVASRVYGLNMGMREVKCVRVAGCAAARCAHVVCVALKPAARDFTLNKSHTNGGAPYAA